MMRHFVLLFLACGLLVSCATKETGLKRLCPQVASLHELDYMADHGRDAITPENLVADATLKRIDGYCEYDDDGVEVIFDLKMEAQKGPRLGGTQVNFPYFVTVVSPDGDVINKESMTQKFVFEEGQKVVEKVESLRVFIPLEEGKDAVSYRVLIGFQLTPEQVEVVREN